MSVDQLVTDLDSNHFKFPLLLDVHSFVCEVLKIANSPERCYWITGYIDINLDHQLEKQICHNILQCNSETITLYESNQAYLEILANSVWDYVDSIIPNTETRSILQINKDIYVFTC